MIFRNCPQARICDFSISASEGRRDSIFNLKWPQWPHLYKCYEAIYALKCLLFEKITKNWFLTKTQKQNLAFFSEFQKFLIPQVFVVNTFSQRLLLLLRMFKVISLGANFEFSCIWAFWPRPFLMFYAMIDFYMIDILGQEGCRDLIFSLKWPQCPHLY